MLTTKASLAFSVRRQLALFHLGGVHHCPALAKKKYATRPDRAEGRLAMAYVRLS